MIQVPTCPLYVSELMLVLFSHCIRNISVDLPKASLVSAPAQPGLYVTHGPRLTVFRFTIHAPGIWEPTHQPIALHLILVDWFLVQFQTKNYASGSRSNNLTLFSDWLSLLTLVYNSALTIYASYSVSLLTVKKTSAADSD
ncbi:hypothetical protein VNO77_43339 [Canavalia gladiata]|uniref:Uncharacterized protein n=1 Tax=Canavalia gladiata TaxID=3824 RepID=A0AAN9PPU9_CANGL